MDKLTRDILVVLLEEQQRLAELVAGLTKALEMEPKAREALAFEVSQAVFQIAESGADPDAKRAAFDGFWTDIRQSGAPDDLKDNVAKLETHHEHREAHVAALVKHLQGLSFDD